MNGDGAYDVTSAQPTYTHAYTTDFDGVVALRLTDNDGRTSIATAIAHVSADGDQIPTAEDNCPTEPNDGQSDYDGDGTGDVCDDAPGFEWPTDDVTPPTSAAGPLEPSYAGPAVDVPFTASDEASGVASVELWARHRVNPLRAWSIWQLAGTNMASPAPYAFDGDAEYEFYTVAVDAAGNREEPPAAADASTRRDAVNDPPDQAAWWGILRSSGCFAEPCPSVEYLFGSGTAFDDRSTITSVEYRYFGIYADGRERRLTNWAQAAADDGAFDEVLETFGTTTNPEASSEYVDYDIEVRVAAGGTVSIVRHQ